MKFRVIEIHNWKPKKNQANQKVARYWSKYPVNLDRTLYQTLYILSFVVKINLKQPMPLRFSAKSHI